MTTEESVSVGYRRPPRSTRFQKGKSGNPRGRPKGRSRQIPYDFVLSQRVTILEAGAERSVTAAEAFLLYLVKRGVEGDTAAAKLAREALQFASALGISGEQDDELIIRYASFGNPAHELESLKMATRVDRFKPSAKVLLEPWIVQTALERLGDKQFTLEEQKAIIDATHKPHQVKWPLSWKTTSP
jgi:hypothetical protein